MKLYTRITATVLLLALALTVLAACGNSLSGTYKTDSVMESYTSLTFSGNKVTIKVFALGAEVSSAEGTYKLSDGSINITLGEGESSDLSGDLSFTKNEDGSIKIGMLTFKKQ